MARKLLIEQAPRRVGIADRLCRAVSCRNSTTLNNASDKAIAVNGVMMQFFHWYVPADGGLWDGTKQQLLSAVRRCQELDVQVYADVVFNHRIGGDEEETFRATPVSNDNRHEVIDEPRDVRSFTKFTFPGRGGKYSPMV